MIGGLLLMKKAVVFVLFLYTMFIFSMSIDKQSNERTLAASRVITSKINISKQDTLDYETTIRKVNFVLRKGAHFLLYFFFAAIISLVAIKFGATFSEAAGYILFFCLLVANLDEFIQNYMNRTSQVGDCLIDLAGATFGVVLSFSLHSLVNRFMMKKKLGAE
jgi:VanZ family protein